MSSIVSQRSESALAHWREYLIEAWALGVFMVSAGLFTALLEHPSSPLTHLIGDESIRRALIGLAMGATAVALIYSPWGKRSGAHMNPAVTLTFLRLGKIAPRDAFAYIVCQFVGATLGVLITLWILRDAFAMPPVNYVVTVPGINPLVAFMAELAISAVLMATVLVLSSAPRFAPFTGLAAGCLVFLYITFEAPLSGMSMNPARSFGSAVIAGIWTDFWIYLTAPLLGMQLAAALFIALRTPRRAPCAKLCHDLRQPCIHCGYRPPEATS